MRVDSTDIDRRRQANMNIYELSQKAPEIYANMESVNDKRIMLNKVFAVMRLGEGIFDYEFTDTFKLLFNAVDMTNSSKIDLIEEEHEKIFEPSILLSNKRKNRALDPVRSTWLRGWDSNPRPIDYM